MDEAKDAQPPAAGPSPRHEVTDVDPRAIARSGAILAGTIVVTLLLVYGFMEYLSARRAKLDVPVSPLARPQIPPIPRLQVNPAEELAAMRAREEEILNSYGWIDREEGLVRIPIARAKELLAERGLPARAESEATESRRSERKPDGRLP